MILPGMFGAAKPSGSSIPADYFEAIAYSGNSTFPRTVGNVVDPTNGLAFVGPNAAAGSWAPFIATANATSGYTRRTFNSTSTPQNLDSANFAISSSGVQYKLNADPGNSWNASGTNYVLYLFKELAGFLDRVNYTGTGANRSVAHSLGSVPGMIWTFEYGGARRIGHRSMTDWTRYLDFSTAVEGTDATVWNSTAPDASNFYLGSSSDSNQNGVEYCAYLWAHDTGPNGVIQCGSYTGNGSATGPTVSLGWDPRLILVKRLAGATGEWWMVDQTRSPSFTGADTISYLSANASNILSSNYVALTGTGFQIVTTDTRANANAATYLYMAIR